MLNGLVLKTDSLVQALLHQDNIWTIRSAGETINSRFLINAAGLHADNIAELAGVRDFSIYPRKGEEYLLDKRLAGLVQTNYLPLSYPRF